MEVIIFQDLKQKEYLYFILIAPNQHQMSQKTYPRSKLVIQVNNVARIESLWSWIISHANVKSLLKLILGIKSLYVNRLSNLLRHLLRQI